MADALKNNDPRTAFDVLWEIEAFPTYVEAVEEEAQREAAAADDKSSKKSSKDKGDKKKSSKVRFTYDFVLCEMNSALCVVFCARCVRFVVVLVSSRTSFFVFLSFPYVSPISRAHGLRRGLAFPVLSLLVLTVLRLLAFVVFMCWKICLVTSHDTLNAKV